MVSLAIESGLILLAELDGSVAYMGWGYLATVTLKACWLLVAASSHAKHHSHR